MWVVYWAALAAVAAVCADFAVSNRLAVSLALWPLPFSIDLQLYLLVFAAVAIGCFAGAIAGWVAGGRRRRELRRCRRRIGALERELGAARERRGGREAPPNPAAPIRH